MNGRTYDYNLGRFLSVDPFIQFPSNSQSLNPYSYLMNNPFAGTDPTGYMMGDTGANAAVIFGVGSGILDEDNARFNEEQFAAAGDNSLIGAADTGTAIKAAIAAGSIAAGLAVAEKTLDKKGKKGRSNRPSNGKDSQPNQPGNNASPSDVKLTAERPNTESSSAKQSPESRANSDQDMVDNLVNHRRDTDAPGAATFAQGRDGDGNLTPIRESTIDGKSHAEPQVLRDLDGKPKPHTVAVDQEPCSTCRPKLREAGARAIVPQDTNKPDRKVKSTSVKAAQGKTTVTVREVDLEDR